MPSPDDAVTVIRSEERLLASTHPVPVRRAVLRKVVVSEERTVTVTVRHEEFRLDYEPVPDDGAPLAASAETPVELVLHEEQVEVVLRVVPVERVRVDVRAVVEQRTVTDALRSERIDVDVDGESVGDPAAGRHRG